MIDRVWTGRRRLQLDITRVDAHPGDLYGREIRPEVSPGLLASELLADVLVPFLASAPRATWTCRSQIRGEWQDWAQVVIDHGDSPPEVRLLIPDETLRSLHAGADGPFPIGCRTR